MRVLSESIPMNTNMTGLRWFSNLFASLSIGRVKGLYIIENDDIHIKFHTFP